jgi:hypothetical protein
MRPILSARGHASNYEQRNAEREFQNIEPLKSGRNQSGHTPFENILHLERQPFLSTGGRPPTAHCDRFPSCIELLP